MSTPDFKKLKDPFPAKDIEWRVQRDGGTKDKPWALVVPYIDNRAIQDRLDDVVSPENWMNEFQAGPCGGVLCGISIKVGDAWVTKWDGAENSKNESIKGGLSDAMKRAGYQWGIGRYLYNLHAGWAVFVAKNKGQYRTKIEGKDCDWNPPALPAWALPGGQESPPAQIPKTAAPKKTPPVDENLVPPPINHPEPDPDVEKLTFLKQSLDECKTTDDVAEWWDVKDNLNAYRSLPTGLKTDLGRYGNFIISGLKPRKKTA